MFQFWKLLLEFFFKLLNLKNYLNLIFNIFILKIIIGIIFIIWI
jgi:hypothetical protein